MAHWQFCQFDASETGLYDAEQPVIHRICAVSFAVLIALPFTAPFAMFDWRDAAVRSRATSVVDVATAAASDDGPVWSDRSGRHHHAMQLAALNSGHASPGVACLFSTPLSPSAMTLVPHDTSVIATVLRIESLPERTG